MPHRSERSMRLAMEAAAWFFDNTLDLFMIVRDGLIERASPSMTNFLGWPEGEAIGRPFWDFVHPRDRQLVSVGVREADVTGQAIYEHRVATKAGDWRWVRVRIKKANDGAAIVVMQDISAERRRLQEAGEAGGAYKVLSAVSGVRLWRFHPQVQQVEFDPDFSTPFLETPPERRVEREAVVGAIHREDWPAVETAWSASVRSGKLTSVEYREQTPQGDWRQFRTAWTGVRQHHTGEWEIVGVNQDLTELMSERDRARRGEEAATTASRAKAEFLANISHELRTPMNGVLGALHLVRAADSETERHRLIEEAIIAGGDLSRLLTDIVDFADADSGRVRIETEPVDIARFLATLAEPYAEQAEEKGLDFRLDDQLGGHFVLDPVRLRQVLGCLVQNALKFTPAGVVTLRARPGALPGTIEIEVQDTGIGIPAERQPGLFQSFHQADGSTTRRYGGAGLGLARARKLVELMGGSIAVASAEGRGSIFSIILAAEARDGAGDDKILQGLSVLLVEDNPTNRMIGSRMLESLGAVVALAEDGREGVNAATGGRFDLIFMDIQMPVMDGVEATRAIRRLPGEAGATPILALTANVLEHQVRLYREAGMDGCIAKPISPPALIAEIARLSGASAAA